MTPRLRIVDPGPIWVYLISLAAFFLRFGYHFGAGDQDELVPFLSSVLDPSLFVHDWFVQAQAAEIGVRTYVVWLLAPFCRVAPMQAVFFGAYLGSWVLIGSGAFRVARRLLGNDVAAAATVFVSMGVLHKWTLGGNDLVYSMFVGEMIAWGLALHAIHGSLEGRDRRAALLLGIASWFQLLVGLLLAGTLVFERIWRRSAAVESDPIPRNDFTALGFFVVAALPAIAPIALQQLHALSTDSGMVFYILAPFRNPFHHMFLSFGVKSIVRFAAMLALGAVSFLLLKSRGAVNDGPCMVRLTSIILLACIVTAVFTEFWPILLVAKLQAFKLTVLLKFLLVAMMAGALFLLLPDGFVDFFNGFVDRGMRRDVLSLIALVAVASLALTRPAFLEPRIAHDVHAASDVGRMESWIAAHLDRDAVFAVPPSNSTFRSNARRAIVVNYAAFPFDDSYMIEWYHRLLAIAPIEPPRSGLGIQPVLDEAYHEHSESEWRALGSRYGIDFLLVDESELKHRLDFEPVHQEGRWTLYRLPG